MRRTKNERELLLNFDADTELAKDVLDQMRAVADHKATHPGLVALQQEILSQPPYTDAELSQDRR